MKIKIQSKYRGIEGFLTVYNRAVRYRHMITKTALRRNKILIYWNKHGIESAIDAFSVSRRTFYHTYPKTPKMNAHSESFNGTIQEELVDYHANLIFDNTTLFNEKMKEYLTFYNTKRVHYAFKNKLTPLEALTKSDYYVSKLPAECKNGRGYSKSCKISRIILYYLNGK